MAGFCPTEGLEEIAIEVVDRSYTNRTGTLELGLFIDAAPGASITYATLNKASGTGSTPKVLVDATWNDTSPGVKTYPPVTFTAGSGGITGTIYGYYVATIPDTGSKKLLCVEVDLDVGVPYTMGENDTYEVTPTINFTPAP
jgi:hypothetical protein